MAEVRHGDELEGKGMSSKRKAPDAADPAHKAAEDPTPNKKKASKSQGRMHRGALLRGLCEHGRRKAQASPLRARAPEGAMYRLRRQQLLRAQAPEGDM